MSEAVDVIIVGAGVAGLCAAQDLQRAGHQIQLFEADTQVGGRVKTTEKDGFLLDHGFQVLLTAYPEAQERLYYPGLKLNSFMQGAKVRVGKAWHTVADPLRHPEWAVSSALSAVGTPLDKYRVFTLRQRLMDSTLNQLWDAPETTTAEYLIRQGFSKNMIQRFFRPFYGGIFLEDALATTSRMFTFTYKLFASGHASLPHHGMGAISTQLAEPLVGMIHLGQSVTHATPTSITLADGRIHHAKAVLLANGPWGQAQLLDNFPQLQAQATTCVYFKAKHIPSGQPWLYLNGNLPPVHTERSQPVINHVCFPSTVQANYAPKGWHLVSVSLNGVYNENQSLVSAIYQQLGKWFGPKASEWVWLETMVIPHALPVFVPPTPEPSSARHESGFFLCGDGQATPSLNGAMASGRRAANEIMTSLKSD